MNLQERYERLKHVNAFIELIASNGRQFFSYKGEASKMLVDKRGRVWFQDSTTGTLIYTHYIGRWKGFSEGGTLRHLVDSFKQYIQTGQKLSPLWICPKRTYDDSNIWGYDEESAELLRSEATKSPIFYDLKEK